MKVPRNGNQLDLAKEKGSRRTRELVAFLHEAKLDPSQFKKIKLTLILPQKMLVEQIRLSLPQHKEKKSKTLFSQNFRILQVECFDPFSNTPSPMHVRSAFSERVTKNGLEINACGVTGAIQITLLCLNKDAWKIFDDPKKVEIDRLV